MNIAIIGTRGIPNRYGGFEAFAEQVSRRWAEKGHRVIVYNPSDHPYLQDRWESVILIRKPFPHKIFGHLAILIYDYLCLRDAYQRRPDVILNCGHGNSLFIRKKHPVPVVTLTDGLEWKRAVWNPLIRLFFRITEKTAVKRSRILVADHPEIAQWLQTKYGVSSEGISYGATIPKNHQTLSGTSLTKMLEHHLRQHSGDNTILANNPNEKLLPDQYFLVVARFVPENNQRMILEGYVQADLPFPLLLIGNTDNKYGRSLMKNYSVHPGVFFAGAVYDQYLLFLLTHHARGYFHGHSAGGTNPSLLEAMAAGCLIAAHDNPFNRYILEEDAPYFSTAEDVTLILKNWNIYQNKKQAVIKEYQEKIQKEYSWEQVAEKYEKLFRKLSKEYLPI